MKILRVALALCVLCLLAGAASKCLADDDVVGLSCQQPVHVGGLTLQPGTYLLQSLSTSPNHSVVVVTDLGKTRFYGVVLANIQFSWQMRSPVDRFVFDETDTQALRTWIVPWKEIGYTFTTAPVPPEIAALAKRRFETRVASR